MAFVSQIAVPTRRPRHQALSARRVSSISASDTLSRRVHPSANLNSSPDGAPQEDPNRAL